MGVLVFVSAKLQLKKLVRKINKKPRGDWPGSFQQITREQYCMLTVLCAQWTLKEPMLA